MIQEGCPQSDHDASTYSFRAAGVLKYNRESDNPITDLSINLTGPPPLTDCAITCEYCGKKTSPSRNLKLQKSKKASHFCCAQRQLWCEILTKERCFSETTLDIKSAQEDDSSSEAGKLRVRGKKKKGHHKASSDSGNGSDRKQSKDHSNRHGDENFDPTSQCFSLRVSCAPASGLWTVCPCKTSDEYLESIEEEPETLAHVCDNKSRQFGICHLQEGAEFHKYYSSGTKFLDVLPNGSAQVLYPSGNLALIIVVTEKKGRVCIVYDDSDASKQAMRGIFQSDGRATCYHSNGSIWLSLNSSGGQCLDEAGARVHRWSWSSPGSTPLHPIYLSLNKAIGVRVFERKKVIVSFMKQGQQAKFSVGACCAQDKCNTEGPASAPPITKDELLVLASRIRIHLAIQHLQQYLATPSHPKPTDSPHLQTIGQKLLKDSAKVRMGSSERDYLHKCLQGCLNPPLMLRVKLPDSNLKKSKKSS